MQGTHSLQLHNELETMSLRTDRGLHVDAQICHRLLSFLAQKKRLKEVQICSGYYSLQSIQGDDFQPVYEGEVTAYIKLIIRTNCLWRLL
jgi:hypothetical protein